MTQSTGCINEVPGQPLLELRGVYIYIYIERERERERRIGNRMSLSATSGSCRPSQQSNKIQSHIFLSLFSQVQLSICPV